MNEEKLSQLLNIKRHIKTTIPLFVAVIGTLYWVASKRETARGDFLTAKKLWHEGEYKQLSRLVKKHPELSALYDGKLAQVELALGTATRAKKVAKGSSTFARFSKGAIAIAEGKYKEALEEALELKECVDESSELFGFLLLRIANLHAELGNSELEKACWREIEGLPSYPRLVKHFKVLGRR